MTRLLAAFILPPAIVFFLQAAANRIFGKNPQLVAIACLLPGAVPFMLAAEALYAGAPKGPGFHAYMLLLYLCSAYSYFHVFNMSETARRIRLISAVAAGIELGAVYDEDRMIRIRLERLAALGQVREQDGLYRPAGSLLWPIAALLCRLGRIMGRPWPAIQRYESTRLRR